jgi:hypothetical protein
MPKRMVVGSSCAAALLSMMAVAAAGQVAPQGAPQSPSPRGTESPTQSRAQGERSAADQQITVVGCVVNESDLQGGGAASADRSARDTASTRSSGGNEFVIVNAQIMPAGATASSGTGGSTGSSATGTSGSSGARAPAASGDRASAPSGATFSLTGDRERELSKYVGERVEIVGKMDRAASSSSSGASRPSDDPVGDRGDRGDRDRAAPSASSSSASMARVEIVSFKPATGSCQ